MQVLFRHGRRLSAVVVPLVLVILSFTGRVLAEGEAMTRDQMIEDIRQLAAVLESTHPDPYINGGGKIAFHKRLHDVIAAVPDEGLTAGELYLRLVPFIAALGDSHTRLNRPSSSRDGHDDGRTLPLLFAPIEKSLVVCGVRGEGLDELLGSVLVSVEGIAFEELLDRQKQQRGSRSDYYHLYRLGHSLRSSVGIGVLLPEWEDRGSIDITLVSGTGTVVRRSLALAADPAAEFHGVETSIPLPSRDRSDFGYQFLDEERRTALLVIDDMATFRETYELARAWDIRFYLDRIDETYRRFFGEEPPEDLDREIAAMPSAAALFRRMAQEMKDAGTERLIVDLRRNAGGNSLMMEILVYYLFGMDGIYDIRIRDRFQATRYSELYLEVHKDVDFADINSARRVVLGPGDYGLSSDVPAEGRESRVQQVLASLDEFFARMPTFYSDYGSGDGAGIYRPPSIAVLCSTRTFSSAYTMMKGLHILGADLIGRPSGQEAHSFGEQIEAVLTHSGLSFYVSTSYWGDPVYDPEARDPHFPDHELTWQKLKEYDFDPNAELLYALDVLGADD